MILRSISLGAGARLLVVFGGLLVVFGGVLAGPAQAKTPEPDELPTLEQIFQEARAEKEADEAAAAEALRDPFQEAIDGYRDGVAELDQYAQLVELINESKDEELQRYRRPAALAVLQRFRSVNLDDPAVRKIRNTLALEIVDLMRANKSDQTGLAIIEHVMKTWWGALINEVDFKATDNFKDRNKAYRRVKSFIKNGERS